MNRDLQDLYTSAPSECILLQRFTRQSLANLGRKLPTLEMSRAGSGEVGGHQLRDGLLLARLEKVLHHKEASARVVEPRRRPFPNQNLGY